MPPTECVPFSRMLAHAMWPWLFMSAIPLSSCWHRHGSLFENDKSGEACGARGERPAEMCVPRLATATTPHRHDALALRASVM